MKAAWRILAEPARRSFAATLAVALLFAGSIGAAIWWSEPRVLVLAALACWFWHLLAGFTLRGILRPETLLLPDFRAHLARAGAIDALLTVALPAAVWIALQGPAHIALVLSGIVAIHAIGLAAGLGYRWVWLLWFVAVGAGWMPGFAESLALAAVDSALTPLLLLLVAALLVRLALGPLLTMRDRGDDETPMQAIADGRKPQAAADGTPQNARGAIGKRLYALFDFTARHALARALARRARRDTAWTRLAVLRAVLLPHDNLAAVLIRFVAVVVLAGAYFFFTRSMRSLNADYAAAYAVIIAVGRFSAVGHGLVRMRPNLADLFLTLGPQRMRDFQRVMADVLLHLIGVALFNALAFTLAIALVLRADNLATLVLAASIATLGGAFGALAVHLVGPESTTGRALAQIFVMGATIAVYGLVHWLLVRFGLVIGSLAGLMFTLPFGLGAWQAARREYLTRRPRFDPVIG